MIKETKSLPCPSCLILATALLCTPFGGILAQGRDGTVQAVRIASKIAAHPWTEANIDRMANAADRDLGRMTSDIVGVALQAALNSTRSLAQNLGIGSRLELLIGNLLDQRILTFVQQAKTAPPGAVSAAMAG